jgi:hypothetical protein
MSLRLGARSLASRDEGRRAARLVPSARDRVREGAGQVWKAAAAAAEAMALEGRALRTMNDWLCVALLSRCGVSDVRDSDLPHPFPAPKPKSSNPVVVAREAASHAKG